MQVTASKNTFFLAEMRKLSLSDLSNPRCRCYVNTFVSRPMQVAAVCMHTTYPNIYIQSDPILLDLEYNRGNSEALAEHTCRSNLIREV